MFGGAARNPIHVLAEILAGLHDANGRVTLPGFYDGVDGDRRRQIKEQWDGLGLTPEKLPRRMSASRIPAGEKGRSVLELVWARPTCEVNGIIGGYTGEGFKTVIPPKASAKVSFRLVDEQDPEKIRAAFRALCARACPGRLHGRVHRAWRQRRRSRCPIDMPGPAQGAGRADATNGARRPRRASASAARSRSSAISSASSAWTSLLVGFGLDDDRIHSPNEKYDLRASTRARSWARILAALAK